MRNPTALGARRESCKTKLSYFRRFWVKEPLVFQKTFRMKTATSGVSRVLSGLYIFQMLFWFRDTTPRWDCMSYAAPKNNVPSPHFSMTILGTHWSV